MIGKFEITRSEGDTYTFRLRADNGMVILQSDPYNNKSCAMQGIESVRCNAPISTRFERLASPQGQPYFTLRSTGGEVVGRSQHYSSIAAMENGIASVARNGPDAVLVDMAPDLRRAATR